MRIDNRAIIVGVIIMTIVGIVVVLFNNKKSINVLTAEEPGCVMCASKYANDKRAMCDCFDTSECPHSYEKYDCADAYGN